MVMGDDAWAAGVKEVESEESTGRCIHCEAIWPVSRMRNGACPGCTKKGLTGRSALSQRRQQYGRGLWILVGIAIVAIIIFR